MARRFVVTTLIGTAMACGHKEPLPGNPPPPPPVPAPAPAPAQVVTSPHELSRFTVVLNGADADRRVFRRSDGTCYVNLPLPPAEGPPVSFRPPPTEVVTCPVHMADPSWDSCAFGTVTADEARSACVCMVMGNPPPPPRLLPSCPTSGVAGSEPAKEP